MKKAALFVLLALCLALCTACTSLLPNPVTAAEATLVPNVSDAVPDAAAPADSSVSRTATLFFRFGNQPYLAAEERVVTRAANESLEHALLTALLKGPANTSGELAAAFPTGVTLISTVAQGRLLFVTLSKELLGGWADEPTDWAQQAAWQVEVPLRRRLCMQSLVCTITENCDFDSVQILVEQSGQVSESLRLRQSWFMDGASDDALTDPLVRADNVVLTPAATLRIVLDAWRSRDWATLYRYVALSETDAGRPDYDLFAAAMESALHLTAYGFSGGTLAPDGRSATYALHVSWLQDGALNREASGRILRLSRLSGIWRVSQSQLLGWTEGLQ